jgi:hypothetical protein
MRYDRSMRYLWLVLLVACSASSSEPIDGADAAQCSPGVRYTCDCGPGKPEGGSTCSKEARKGACECGGTSAPPDEDGGAPDANCSSPSTFYRDTDGDGFGSGVPTPACERPAGYATKDGDCDDADARAYPGQTAFFTTPRPGGSFDFECDPGVIEKQYPTGAQCALFPVGGGQFECRMSNVGAGWYQAPTECGGAGLWLVACSAGCGPATEPRTQGCR